MPGRIVFGYLSGTTPVVSNPSDAKSRFENKWSIGFNTPAIAIGKLATAYSGGTPTAWTNDPYYIYAKATSGGANYGASLKYDGTLNQLYVDANGTQFGTASLGKCGGGCTDCLIVIADGKQSGCTCFDDNGSCAGEILT